MVVVDLIPHNSTEEIVKETLEEAVAVGTSSLSGKTARSHEGNVDDEPQAPWMNFPWSQLRFEPMMMKVPV